MIIKCEGCGASLNFNEGDHLAICSFCGATNVIGGEENESIISDIKSIVRNIDGTPPNYLERASVHLLAEEYNEAYDDARAAIELAPRMIGAYLTALMARLRVSTPGQLGELSVDFTEFDEYKKIILLGSPTDRQIIEGYGTAARLRAERCEKIKELEYRLDEIDKELAECERKIETYGERAENVSAMLEESISRTKNSAVMYLLLFLSSIVAFGYSVYVMLGGDLGTFWLSVLISVGLQIPNIVKVRANVTRDIVPGNDFIGNNNVMSFGVVGTYWSVRALLSDMSKDSHWARELDAYISIIEGAERSVPRLQKEKALLMERLGELK